MIRARILASRNISFFCHSGPIEWRHVRSEDNPADALSRDQLPHAFLRNQTWLTGLLWLIKNENEWPKEVTRASELPELKKNTCLTITTYNLGLLERFFSYSKLRIRIDFVSGLPTNRIVKCRGDQAEIRVLKILQTSRFTDVIKGLENKNPVIKGRLRHPHWS